MVGGGGGGSSSRNGIVGKMKGGFKIGRGRGIEKERK